VRDATDEELEQAYSGGATRAVVVHAMTPVAAAAAHKRRSPCARPDAPCVLGLPACSGTHGQAARTGHRDGPGVGSDKHRPQRPEKARPLTA